MSKSADGNSAGGGAVDGRSTSPLRHLPNLICVLRILLVVPIVALLLAERPLPALLLIAVATVSDVVDGFLAKRFGWRSRLGGLLDPAADKILLVSLFLTLTWLEWVPLWLTAVVVARDVIIVLGSLAYNALIEPLIAQPSIVGKLNTAGQSLYLLLVIAVQAVGANAQLLLIGAGAVVFALAVVSGSDYAMTWARRSWRVRHGG